MELVKPYFLSAYQEGGFWQKIERRINGVRYLVNRYNHGLAHGLRQGVLARDILDLLRSMKSAYGALDHTDLNDLADWVHSKRDTTLEHQVQFASSFQRSGRQSEASSTHDLERYKRYELQDALNFRKAALASPLFTKRDEIKIFEKRPGRISRNQWILEAIAVQLK
jgi:hypothetical protein